MYLSDLRKLLSSTLPRCCFSYAKRGDSNFSAVTLWMETYSLTIQMKAIEQYFAVVLFITQNEAIRTFDHDSVDEILQFSN